MKLDTIALPLSIIFLVGTLFYVNEANKEKVMIDCSLSEISPDIPVTVKQLCRKARHGTNA
jgi:hypothetical protein